MSRHLTVLTGASRGMGRAMASQLLRRGDTLLCISRHADPALDAEAVQAGVRLEQWCHDLADPGPAARRLRQWLAAQGNDAFSLATLIHNAALIPRIAPLHALNATADDQGLAQALRVGLEAPMRLTAAFLAATRSWAVQRRVLGISSGLGRRPMASQAPYCAVKAGMDHFIRCLALEEAARPNGARVCSLAPGVIDTDMQAQLRSADDEAFPDVGGFRRMKDAGQLTAPADAAARVLAWLARPDFGEQPVADVRG